MDHSVHVMQPSATVIVTVRSLRSRFSQLRDSFLQHLTVAVRFMHQPLLPNNTQTTPCICTRNITAQRYPWPFVVQRETAARSPSHLSTAPSRSELHHHNGVPATELLRHRHSLRFAPAQFQQIQKRKSGWSLTIVYLNITDFWPISV